MGTRHLIAVYSSGKPVIAQYGQWDGYPSGQGVAVLSFLKDESQVYALKTYRLSRISFLTEKETDKIDKTLDNPLALMPQLSRNMGAKILDLAATCDSLKLVNSIEFAGDGLFCEWAYVINFDENVFEVYEGFKEAGFPVEGRFRDFKPLTDGYAPVTLVKSWPLDALPSEEEFLAVLEPQEAEADA